MTFKQACSVPREPSNPKAGKAQPFKKSLSNDPNRVVFSEFHGHGTPISSYMIRKGHWKHLYYTDGPAQLFDLKNDPDELTNLASTKPKIVSELDAELQKICSPQVESDRADQFTTNQLKAVADIPANPSSLN